MLAGLLPSWLWKRPAEAPFGPVVTAIITPFDPDGAVDYGTFWKLVRHMLRRNGSTDLVTGTTGESPTLTNAEKIALYKAAVDAAGDKGKIIAGTGTYNTPESVEMSEKAAKAGVHGIMAVSAVLLEASAGGHASATSRRLQTHRPCR